MFILSQPYWCLQTKKLFNKSCQVICTYEGNAMQTTKYGIIWSENVHFVTNLPVPLTGMGGLYPRVRDFFKYVFRWEPTTTCRFFCLFVCCHQFLLLQLRL